MDALCSDDAGVDISHEDLLQFLALFTTRDGKGAMTHSLDAIATRMGASKSQKRTYVTRLLAMVDPFSKGTRCAGALNDEQRALFNAAWATRLAMRERHVLDDSTDANAINVDDEIWQIHVNNVRKNVYHDDRCSLSVAPAQLDPHTDAKFTHDEIAQFYSLYTDIDPATGKPTLDKEGIKRCLSVDDNAFKHLVKIARELGAPPRHQNRRPRGLTRPPTEEQDEPVQAPPARRRRFEADETRESA